ncbi:uncharacterized protein LOC119680791 isoform X1 [Teleopsis dalmanni]|nr:uncharacterized protein LOC119680791 isoform X1 [Teleopsis dalmanni]
MLDITRDKPVKVSVKVAVPVRDHPKFNFVGKLLGPKGNSMKRLQEDTMCKMAVLGRGSMRDRKKEEELRASGDSRYAHLFEDLHVEISTFAAPAEAHARIAYALAEVRRFLVPDYHDDIRQEQMWEMQALTSTPTLSHSSDQPSPNRGAVTDMDTSNDDKSETDTSIMEFNPAEKLESHHINSNNDHQKHQHLHHLLQQQAHCVTTNTNSVLTTPNADNMTVQANATSIHPTAMAVALQHQLTAAGIGSILKPATGVTAVTGLTPTQPNAGIAIPTEADTTASTLALLDPPGTLLHPALRGVKAINIAGGLGRKRPLLGVPRSGMNPTKRTVMTLLARAKNSQALHTVRNPVTAAATFADYPIADPDNTIKNYVRLNGKYPLQMLASPFILSHQPVEQSMITISKESLAQGV